MIEYRLLKAFVHVAEELHFGRAAARLRVAQPALSRQIQQLEERLEVQLLERSQRRVALTPAGRFYQQRAYKILSDIERATIDVRKVNSGKAGRLSVGFIHSSSFSVTPRLLRRFREQYPDVELELTELTMAQQLEALEARRIDVGVMRPPFSESKIASHPIRTERFVIAVPDTHRLASLTEVDLAQLAQEDFVLFSQSRSPLFHSRIIAMAELAGFVPKAAQQATQIHTVLGLVSANVGISVVPVVAKDLNIPNIHYLEITDRPPPVHVVLAWLRSDNSPILRAFTDFVKQAYPLPESS